MLLEMGSKCFKELWVGMHAKKALVVLYDAIK